MKKLITTITLCIVAIGFSQTTINKSSIDSGGASVTNVSTTLIYTIGEVVVQEKSVGNIYISEGFIGNTTLHETLGIHNYTQLEGIKVFPNPTTNFVNITLNTINNYEIILFDSNGKQLLKSNIEYTNKETLDLINIPSGLYLLVIKNSNQESFKTYKILKE